MSLKQIRSLIRRTHARIHWLRQHDDYVSEDPLESDMLEIRLGLLAERKREALSFRSKNIEMQG
jgi:phage terminase Nu1 subunit (DNA packaging protein)